MTWVLETLLSAFWLKKQLFVRRATEKWLIHLRYVRAMQIGDIEVACEVFIEYKYMMLSWETNWPFCEKKTREITPMIK